MSKYILEGKKLCQQYKRTDGKILTACKNIDFCLKQGETVGLVGESGCGKSTVLRMLVQLEKPHSGQLLYQGQDITHRKGKELRNNRHHIQMVFQDPATAFSPRMKVYDAIGEPLKNFYKLGKTELGEKISSLLTQVGLPTEYANRYCHAMSGGQRQRLGIARALALDPAVLICDEATSALDVSIQKTIIELLVDIQKQRNLAMVFVCHDIALVQSLSHKIMVMYLGNVVEILNGKDLTFNAVHPYTQLLISSIFSLNMDMAKEIPDIEGEMPSPFDVPLGCPFHSRCAKALEICKKNQPIMKNISENHQVACHLYS